MTNQQLYLAIGIPILFNAAFLGAVVAFLSAKFEVVNSKFEAVDKRFQGIDNRFDDLRDLWRAELRRVEEVLDARLTHLEKR